MTVMGANEASAKAAVTLVLILDPLRIARPGRAIDLQPLDAILLESGHSNVSVEGHGRTAVSEITTDTDSI